MTNYLFYIDGLDEELWVTAANMREAREAVWQQISRDEAPLVTGMTCIEMEPL